MRIWQRRHQAYRPRLMSTLRQMDPVQEGSAGITSRIERVEKRLYTKTLLRLATYLDDSIYTFFIGVPEIVVFPAEVTLPRSPYPK